MVIHLATYMGQSGNISRQKSSISHIKSTVSE